jgi:hypothetical protein
MTGTKKMRYFQTDTGFAVIYLDEVYEGGTPEEVLDKVHQVIIFKRLAEIASRLPFFGYGDFVEPIGLN